VQRVSVNWCLLFTSTMWIASYITDVTSIVPVRCPDRFAVAAAHTLAWTAGNSASEVAEEPWAAARMGLQKPPGHRTGTCMSVEIVRGGMFARLRASRMAASIVALVALTGTLAYAAVHTRLESSVPAADEVLSAPPERFELRFSGPVNDALSVVVLTYPSGDSVSLDVSSPVDDSRILVADTPPLEQGVHLVRWRTVSADGHPVDGEFRFTRRVTDGSPMIPRPRTQRSKRTPAHRSSQPHRRRRSGPRSSPDSASPVCSGSRGCCGSAALFRCCGSPGSARSASPSGGQPWVSWPWTWSVG